MIAPLSNYVVPEQIVPPAMLKKMYKEMSWKRSEDARNFFLNLPIFMSSARSWNYTPTRPWWMTSSRGFGIGAGASTVFTI